MLINHDKAKPANLTYMHTYSYSTNIAVDTTFDTDKTRNQISTLFWLLKVKRGI